MLKHFFAGAAMLTMLSTSALQANAYANFFSTVTSDISGASSNPYGGVISFENQNEVKHIEIINSNQDIVFRKSGVYLIEYNVTCAPTGSSLTNQAWSIGLSLNGNLVPGSIFGVADLLTVDDVVDIGGGVIIKANWGDHLQVVNTSSNGITINSEVSGSTSGQVNESASIRIVGLHHKDRD